MAIHCVFPAALSLGSSIMYMHLKQLFTHVHTVCCTVYVYTVPSLKTVYVCAQCETLTDLVRRVNDLHTRQVLHSRQVDDLRTNWRMEFHRLTTQLSTKVDSVNNISVSEPSSQTQVGICRVKLLKQVKQIIGDIMSANYNFPRHFIWYFIFDCLRTFAS